MLELTLPVTELYFSDTNQFQTLPSLTIKLEHSLISISKWEQAFNKCFIEYFKECDIHSNEFLYYVRCMCLNRDLNDLVLRNQLSDQILNEIVEYMNKPMSATTIGHYGEEKTKGQKSSEKLTSEIIYWMMIQYKIPIEFEKWHLNRLLMMLDVCNVKANDKKMSKEESAKWQREENKRRRAMLKAQKGK